MRGADRNTTDHVPFTGNSTRPTVRNEVPLAENKVSKIWRRPLYRPEITGVRASSTSPNSITERPTRLAVRSPAASPPGTR